MKFRKKPVVIEAVQLRWDNWGEMCDHAGVGYLSSGQPEGTYLDKEGRPSEVPVSMDFTGSEQRAVFKIGLLIPTLEGVMIGTEGDWIIKGIKGELYPCKPDIFELTYEPIPE